MLICGSTSACPARIADQRRRGDRIILDRRSDTPTISDVAHAALLARFRSAGRSGCTAAGSPDRGPARAGRSAGRSRAATVTASGLAAARNTPAPSTTLVNAAVQRRSPVGVTTGRGEAEGALRRAGHAILPDPLPAGQVADRQLVAELVAEGRGEAIDRGVLLVEVDDAEIVAASTPGSGPSLSCVLEYGTP